MEIEFPNKKAPWFKSPGAAALLQCCSLCGCIDLVQPYAFCRVF